MIALKNVLRINALSSGATGIGAILFASPVTDLFGLNNSTAILAVGIFLLAFALLVFRESQRSIQNWKAVRTIIALDITWVVLSAAIVLLQLFNLSLWGYLSIAAVALWVAGMAYLQHAGLKRIPSIRGNFFAK